MEESTYSINTQPTNIIALPLDLVLQEKWQVLVSRLQALSGAVVAFAGGVDSSYLAAAAHLVPGPRMLAGTIHAINFEIVCVRYLDALARIEVIPQAIPRLVALREIIPAYFKQPGFRYVTVDLEGFRSGSLNEVLNTSEDIPQS
jgi:PP-loop superfamily ATP-utilizing enzyme